MIHIITIYIYYTSVKHISLNFNVCLFLQQNGEIYDASTTNGSAFESINLENLTSLLQQSSSAVGARVMSVNELVPCGTQVHSQYTLSEEETSTYLGYDGVSENLIY